MPISEITKIINSEVAIGRCDTTCSITLKESGRFAKLKGVTITGVDSEYLAFKLDESGRDYIQLSKYLNKSEKNINKGCDGIIAAKIGDDYYLFVCELKSDDPKGFIEQMKSSHAFLDYINSLLEKFYGKSLADFKRINVLFTTKVDKLPVNPKKRTPNVVSRSGIEYVHQSCKSGRDLSHVHIKSLIDACS